MADLHPQLLDKPPQDFLLIEDMKKSKPGARLCQTPLHPPQHLGKKQANNIKIRPMQSKPVSVKLH